MYNSLGSGGNSGQSNNEVYILNNGKQIDAIADDSLICGILERAPQEESGNEGEMYYTSTTIIEKCLALSGPEARVALARFFPYYCLTDENVDVRRIALQSISKYPDLVFKYYNEILLR